MTVIVVVDTAPPSSKLDEVAIFNKVLSAPFMSELYNTRDVDYRDDPRDSPGWVEMYGKDQPTPGDPGGVPVMANGICRVSYVTSLAVYSVELFEPTVGYLEVGRIGVYHDDDGTVTQHGLLESAKLIEWTPERAIVRVITTATSLSGDQYRMETYVTLQRGWNGPRVECYPSPAASGDRLGAHVRWTAASEQPQELIRRWAGATPATIVADTEDPSWNGATPVDFDVAGAEPWVAMLGGEYMVGLIAARKGVVVRTYNDAGAFGTLHKAVAFCADYGTIEAGYASMRVYFGPRSWPWPPEAEDYIRTAGGAAVAQVADAAAHNGQAAESTSTANPADPIRIDRSRWNSGNGTYGIWVRARVANAGATGRFEAWADDNTSTSPPVDTTSTSYTWLYLGMLTITDLDLHINIRFWRTAGTGGIRMDRLAILPIDLDDSIEGMREQGISDLLDTRAVPELIER